MFLWTEVLKFTCITLFSTGTKRKRKTRSWACQRNGWRWWRFPLNSKSLLSVIVCNSCSSCSINKNVFFDVVLVFLLSYSLNLGVLDPPTPSELPVTFHGLGMDVFWNHTLANLHSSRNRIYGAPSFKVHTTLLSQEITVYNNYSFAKYNELL